MARKLIKAAGKIGLMLQAAIDGLSKMPDTASFVFNGAVMTPSAVKAEFDALNAPFAAVEADHVKTKKDEQARDNSVPTARKALKNLKAGLGALYGTDSTDLTAFGFKPEEDPTPLTSDQFVARKNKANATREKNRTMGSKQKAALDKGTTPPPPPAPPAPPAK